MGIWSLFPMMHSNTCAAALPAVCVMWTISTSICVCCIGTDTTTVCLRPTATWLLICFWHIQALFAEDTETKLSVQIGKRKLILLAVGDDPPSQMAQLLALEYLVGVTDPDRLNQVGLCASLKLPL